MEKMQKTEITDDFVDFTKKLTRLGFVAKTLQQDTGKNDEDTNIWKTEVDCPTCRGDGDDKSVPHRQPHIQDLCPADKERIAQFVEKIAECTQARHKTEAELVKLRSQHEILLSRYEIHCNEHEIEKNHLKDQLNDATYRADLLKKRSSKSLEALGEQLQAQECEFTRLTETVRELLREKINLQNAIIERDSRLRISEAKLERAKETLEMEKLLFMKEHVKDSMIRTFQNRGCQTFREDEIIRVDDKTSIGDLKKIDTTIKCKNDLDEASMDGILLRSLFFKTNNYDDDDDDSPINLLYRSTKN